MAGNDYWARKLLTGQILAAVADFSWPAFFDTILGCGRSELALEAFMLKKNCHVARINEDGWRGTKPEHHSLLEAEQDERRRARQVRDRVRVLRLWGGCGGV